MTDDSKQGFLNSLFQWTIKNTASEAQSPITTVDDKTMDEEVGTRAIRNI